MNEVTVLLPLYAFMAWTGKTLPLCMCYILLCIWYPALGGLFEKGRPIQSTRLTDLVRSTIL